MHVDVAAAGGEGVDLIVIEDEELEFQLAIGVLAAIWPDLLDVVLHRLVLIEAVALWSSWVWMRRALSCSPLVGGETAANTPLVS